MFCQRSMSTCHARFGIWYRPTGKKLINLSFLRTSSVKSDDSKSEGFPKKDKVVGNEGSPDFSGDACAERSIDTRQLSKQESKTKGNSRIVDAVAASLHPQQNDAKRRWSTKAELSERLDKLKATTLSRRKHGMNASVHKGVKQSRKNAMSVSKAVDVSLVEQCANILKEDNGRINIFKLKTDTAEGDDHVYMEGDDLNNDHKTAIDWWDVIAEQNRKVTHVQAPRNHYMEMLEWSEQGRLAQFPIDNEEGIEEERDVPFYKHVFLEDLLNEGFPKAGPVRKFMEAVALGLSLNPYFTLKEKEEHIDWFRKYFDEKKDTLMTLGAITDGETESTHHEL